MSEPPVEFCSFCGCHTGDCEHLFHGPRTAICGECVLTALGVMLHGYPQPDPEIEAQREHVKNALRNLPWLEMKREPSP
jgi:hypothetical protein